MYGSSQQWSISITLKKSYYQNQSQNIQIPNGSEEQVHNKFIDNKSHCHLKLTDLPMPTFYGQPKINKLGVPICSQSCTQSFGGHTGKNELKGPHYGWGSVREIC